MTPSDFLPEPLSPDPFVLFADWFATARERRVQPNPDAMVLATTQAGRPSARVVLCKQLVASPGYVVFFTNYESRKGREIETLHQAAVVFHWDAMSRQVRLEGPVVRSPSTESDAYFASRPVASRVGAWASHQSEPLASKATMEQQVATIAARFNVTKETTQADIPRPPHWGGYRLWPDAMELWVEGPGRVHDRARWTRTLTPEGAADFLPGPWQGTRLNP